MKQPLQYHAHSIALYQDLASITLQKRKAFRDVTSFLKDKGVPYSWVHPFRLIFKWNGKLHQCVPSRTPETYWGSPTMVGTHPPFHPNVQQRPTDGKEWAIDDTRDCGETGPSHAVTGESGSCGGCVQR